MAKRQKNVTEVSEKQELHSAFLDTLGEGISGDYQRIIKVIAALKNVDRIEKRSLARKTIKEATKNKRILEVLEGYDIVDEFVKEEQARETEEIEENTNESFEEKNEEQQESVEIEEKSDAGIESVTEQSETEEIADDITSEKSKKELRLAGYDGRKTTFTMNKEKTLEYISNNISVLMEKIQSAKEINAEGKDVGQKLEEENLYYDGVISILKGYQDFVKKQDKEIKKVNKERDAEKIEQAEVVVGNENALGEIEDAEIVEDAENGEKSEDVQDETIADGFDAGVVAGAVAVDPVLENLRKAMDEVRNRGNNSEERVDDGMGVGDDFELITDTELTEEQAEASEERVDDGMGLGDDFELITDIELTEEQAEAIEQDTETLRTNEDFEFVSDVEYDVKLDADENYEFVTDVEYEPKLVDQEVEIEVTDVEGEPKSTSTPEPEPKSKQTRTANQTGSKVQYIYVGNVPQAKKEKTEVYDGPDKVPDGAPVGTKTPKNKNGAVIIDNGGEKEKIEKCEKTEVEEKTNESAMQELENWATQIVKKYKTKEKIDKILKKDKSVDSIAEKIKNDEITINDAIKAVSEKMVQETGKSDKKALDKIQKHLEKKVNSKNKQEKSKDKTGLQKVSWWSKIVNLIFKRNKGKKASTKGDKVTPGITADGGKTDKKAAQPAKKETQSSNDFRQKYVAPALKNVEIGGIVIGDKNGTENHLNQPTITVVLNEGKKDEKKVRYYGGPEYELRVPVKPTINNTQKPKKIQKDDEIELE